MQVNCYEVIGENDAKTEGTLRARFERASSCSPCILLLRNIDAFAQTTQGLEPGKGGTSSLLLGYLALTIYRTQHRGCTPRMYSKLAAGMEPVWLPCPCAGYD